MNNLNRKKDTIISPVGLKGNQINERMIELMGIKTINENKSHSAVELTKLGPDGKAYAIVRENHEYYIKVSDKTKNLIPEDFQYIGGLKNKKSHMQPTYAKAIKQLRLKFNSLADHLNEGYEISTFENDNLLSLNDFPKNGGFTGEGNLEGNIPLPIAEDKTKNNPWAICTKSVGRDDKEKFESCVKDVKKQHGISETLTEEEMNDDEDIEMTDDEKEINEMLKDPNRLSENIQSIEETLASLDLLLQNSIVKKKV